jgi:hypothetical protein
MFSKWRRLERLKRLIAKMERPKSCEQDHFLELDLRKDKDVRERVRLAMQTNTVVLIHNYNPPLGLQTLGDREGIFTDILSAQKLVAPYGRFPNSMVTKLKDFKM